MLKKIGIGLFCIIIIGALFGYNKYQSVFGPNVPTDSKDYIFQIPTGTNLNTLKSLLVEKNLIEDSSSFEWVASLMKFTNKKVKAGQFKIEPGWSNRELIKHLRSGKQVPVNLVLNNERLLSGVAGKVSQYIEPDSAAILDALLSNENFEKLGLNRETVMTIFIPNSYQVYWNTSPDEFVQKMVKECNKFWASNSRESKLLSLGMSKEEVYTLASIVEKETNYKPEKATVAGVYLNRIKKGILLQADPTVVFANNDFGIRRVLNKHLEIDSPYNTYKYAGIPPGPISMASISSIDAVLLNQDHKYYYFCAKPDNSGQHAFAKTLAQHNSNARKFQKWLNKQRIFK